MKHSLMASVFFIFCSLITAQKTPNQENVFIENKGQWDNEVLFLTKLNGMNVWITSKGVLYDIYKVNNIHSNENLFEEVIDQDSSKVEGQVVRLTFNNSNNVIKKGKLIESAGVHNYFVGNNPDNWISNVHLYSEINLSNLYQGIDIRFYFDKGSLRYDFMVNPGADPEQIEMKIEGADSYYINNFNELVISSRYGDFKHGELFTYQNNKESVKSQFRINENNSISIDVSEYNHELPLIIDPILYSSFLPSWGAEVITAVSKTTSNNLICAGHTNSSGFPTTVGAYSGTYVGNLDLFVTQFKNDNSTLKFSTFIGATGDELCYDMHVDKNNFIYITGYFTSFDFPTTAGAYDQSVNGEYDAFITKLDSNGSSLIYSTMIGSDLHDVGHDIDVDTSGNAYLAGLTYSAAFPLTVGSFDHTFAAPSEAFVLKLNSTGSSLIYSTFLGGNELDKAAAIEVDPTGAVYVAGTTNSSNFPTTPGAFDVSDDLYRDVFVSKLNSTGSALIFSTYLGGDSDDEATSIQLDGNNRLYITGTTSSTDFPTTGGVYDITYNGWDDVFVTRLNNTGSSLTYSTYFGGTGHDRAEALTVSDNNQVFVTGYTLSTNFPLSTIPDDNSLSGTQDAFLFQLNAAGTSLVYSTYLGGAGAETGYGIDYDYEGNVWVAGSTNSSDFPTTPGCFANTLFDSDGFFTQFEFGLSISIEDENAQLAMIVFPNPSNGITHISTNHENELSVELINGMGQVVGKYLFNQFMSSFDVSNFPSGTYFVKISTDQWVKFEKLIVSHK